MNWNRLQYFYHVAKIGNLTLASKQLNISQSALSRRIILLEEQLKTKLFTRHHSGLILTEMGKIWFNYVSEIFAKIEQAKRYVEANKNNLFGNVTVYATAGIARILLLENITKFSEEYPNVKLNILSREKFPEFSQGMESAIFPYLQSRPDLVHEYLGTVKLCLYASKEYLRKFGTPKTTKDLDNHRLITYGSHTHPFTYSNWMLSVGKSEGTTRDPYIQINQPENIIYLAKRNAGIVMLREKRGGQEGLIQVLPHLKSPSMDMYYIYPEYLKGSKCIEIVGDFIKKQAKQKYSQKDD